MPLRSGWSIPLAAHSGLTIVSRRRSAGDWRLVKARQVRRPRSGFWRPVVSRGRDVHQLGDDSQFRFQ